jgi:hypothetical protein
LIPSDFGTVGTRDHWQHVYATRAPEEVSWHEQSPQTSLELIDASGVAGDAPIIDVGGGSSRLAGELLRRGLQRRHRRRRPLELPSSAPVGSSVKGQLG